MCYYAEYSKTTRTFKLNYIISYKCISEIFKFPPLNCTQCKFEWMYAHIMAHMWFTKIRYSAFYNTLNFKNTALLFAQHFPKLHAVQIVSKLILSTVPRIGHRVKNQFQSSYNCLYLHFTFNKLI